MKRFFFQLFLICLPAFLLAQDFSAYQKKQFISKGDTLLYRLLYPKDYNPAKAYPVITLLHGSGERGNDNEAQLIHGGSLFLDEQLRNEFKAIVIFPQCPKDSTWRYFRSAPDTSSLTGRKIDFTMAPTDPLPFRLVKQLLDNLIKTHVADKRQMYIGGLSLGGFGTFNMIERYPRYFAAAFPICGGGDTSAAKRFAKHTAVWIFHGDQDHSVDVNYSRQYYSALKKQDADVRYTEYAGVNHNSWDNAFREKDLVHWLFTHKLR